MHLPWKERQRRRGHHVADRRELLWRRQRGCREARDRLRRCWQDEDAAGELRELVQSELQSSDHTEIAAATSDGPEEISVLRSIGAHVATVGRYDLGCQQRIDREPELPHEKANAAAQGDATDADGAGVAEADDEPVLGERFGDLDGRGSRLDPRGARVGVDIDFRHPTQVDHEPAISRAVAGDAVTAAAHGEFIPFIASLRDHVTYVCDIRDANDRRWPLVDATVENGPGLVVGRIFGCNDASLHLDEIVG